MSESTDPLALRHHQDRQAQERLREQCAFVRAIAPLHGAEGESWEALCAGAEQGFAASVKAGAPVAEALTDAEARLMPIAATAKRYTLHCIGHAHIDMDWQWPWQETVAVSVDTLRSVLGLLDQYPDFHFSQSQASVYDILRCHAPELLEQVRRHVASGRFEVTASHWVEGDRLMAGGEALCRQLVQARRFAREHLGLEPEAVTVDWVPDCFGHAGTIPMIDAAAGVRRAYLWRTGGTDRPAAFWWRSPDGSRILAWRGLCPYNEAPWPKRWQMLAQVRRELDLYDAMLVYGVGDHGGGPTRRHLEMIRNQDSWPVFPRWQMGTSTAFFERLEAAGDRLPVWDGELITEYSGCLVSQAAIKRAVRRCENVLCAADAARAVSQGLGADQPQPAALDAAWRRTLLMHFHDILPGSGVAATRDRCLGESQSVLADAQTAHSRALRALAGRLDTSGLDLALAAPGAPVADNCGAGAGWAQGGAQASHAVHGWPALALVANPCAWPRHETLRLRVWEGDQPWPERGQAFICKDGQGHPLPSQQLGSGHWWGHNYVDLAVQVGLASAGWTAVVVAPGSPAPPPHAAVAIEDLEGGRNHPPPICIPQGRLGLANDRLQVLFDRSSGGIASLRLDGQEFVDPARPLGLPEALVERPHAFASWALSVPSRRERPVCEHLAVVDAGPVEVAVEARFSWRASSITCRWSLAAGETRLRLRVSLRWLEVGGPQVGMPGLGLLLPTALEQVQAQYETPCGAVQRQAEPDRLLPALRWVRLGGQLAGGAAGLVVANDGLANAAVAGGDLRLALVRSSYDPDPLPDLGDHVWNLSLLPHAGQGDDALALRHGAELNQPVAVTWAGAQAGDLPLTAPDLLTCSPDTVVITQLKPAEDGEGLVLRLYNSSDQGAAVHLSLSPLLAGLTQAHCCDLLERPVAEECCLEDGVITLSLSAQGMVSVLVRE